MTVYLVRPLILSRLRLDLLFNPLCDWLFHFLHLHVAIFNGLLHLRVCAPRSVCVYLHVHASIDVSIPDDADICRQTESRQSHTVRHQQRWIRGAMSGGEGASNLNGYAFIENLLILHSNLLDLTLC